MQSSATKQEALGVQEPAAPFPAHQQICQKLEKVEESLSLKRGVKIRALHVLGF